MTAKRRKKAVPLLEVLVFARPDAPWLELRSAPAVGSYDHAWQAIEEAKTIGDVLKVLGCTLDDFVANYGDYLDWETPRKSLRATYIRDGRRERVTRSTLLAHTAWARAHMAGMIMEVIGDQCDSQEDDDLPSLLAPVWTDPRLEGLLRTEGGSGPGTGGRAHAYSVRGEEGLAALQRVLEDPQTEPSCRVVFKRM